MSRPKKSAKRRGATTVEVAFVLPITLFFLIALVIGALGVFRYQEVAALAREGARYASTHGAQYRSDSGESIGTNSDWTSDVKTNAILPRVVDLDTSKLSVSVSWPAVINQPNNSDNWPGSKVTVTVSYQWMPEMWLVGPITLTSTAVMPVTN